MHILILGGSGRTGRLIISSALLANHTVTALVRHPTTFPLPAHANLKLIIGSPLSASDISIAVASSATPPDAIVIALASLRTSDSPFAKPVSDPTFMYDVHVLVLAAMKEHRIKRLVTISAFGVGDSNPNVFWPMRMVLNHSGMTRGQEDHGRVEELMRTQEKEGWGLAAVSVRPTMLSDGEEGVVRVLGDKGEGAGAMVSVSRKSVAKWVVEEALRGEKWVERTPVLAN